MNFNVFPHSFQGVTSSRLERTVRDGKDFPGVLERSVFLTVCMFVTGRSLCVFDRFKARKDRKRSGKVKKRLETEDKIKQAKALDFLELVPGTINGIF